MAEFRRVRTFFLPYSCYSFKSDILRKRFGCLSLPRKKSFTTASRSGIFFQWSFVYCTRWTRRIRKIRPQKMPYQVHSVCVWWSSVCVFFRSVSDVWACMVFPFPPPDKKMYPTDAFFFLERCQVETQVHPTSWLLLSACHLHLAWHGEKASVRD